MDGKREVGRLEVEDVEAVAIFVARPMTVGFLSSFDLDDPTLFVAFPLLPPRLSLRFTTSIGISCMLNVRRVAVAALAMASLGP